MNKIDKQLINRIDTQLTKREIKYARKLARELNKTFDEIIIRIENNNLNLSDLELAHAIALNAIALERSVTINIFSKIQADYFNSKFNTNFSVSESAIEIFKLEYAVNNTLELSKLKADTTFNQIKKLIQDDLTVNPEFNPNNLAKKIRQLKTLSKPRALMIARTETHSMASYSQHKTALLFQSELGLPMFKTWSPVLDKRTRKTHQAMKGKTVPINEKFKVGGSLLDYPGDPSGEPKEVINCRCVLLYTT